ncbi:universal stress protein [Streptomyces somaliensis]|uniref:universal stress protein n=1 Tax=Streptomyces somaliensis TaxID=78355 RepID=UPI0020CCACCF|nr:universal stress protein [Streptomyces somaliensis]MCP9946999.1 universal stress protein [Streptomyces somaliensis]MCP9963636.1 universal stress protein [Streptomyces somaliensis]MCP9972852.1 universal stress protein [Streptomyces somaliensis]MCP9976040.1 universal stress protein [Streptomyces somaliensis]
MHHDTTRAPVIAGVDGSPHASAAVLWAAAEAYRRRQPLHLLHATGTEGRAADETAERARAAGHGLLARTAGTVARRFPDVTVVRRLAPGDAVRALHDEAGAEGTVVVGHRGLGGFGELLLGSVGLGLAARAEAPLVVVRGAHDHAAAGVVVACVRDGRDRAWVRHAAREAELRRAALCLVTAWSPLAHAGDAPTVLDGVEGTARLRETQDLADAIRGEFAGLTVTVEVEGGRSTAGPLVRASHRADLVAVGARRPASGAGRGVGHVVHALLHHAHCPVAVVPCEPRPREER